MTCDACIAMAAQSPGCCDFPGFIGSQRGNLGLQAGEEPLSSVGCFQTLNVLLEGL